jgi:hypothetical protein
MQIVVQSTYVQQVGCVTTLNALTCCVSSLIQRTNVLCCVMLANVLQRVGNCAGQPEDTGITHAFACDAKATKGEDLCYGT